MISGGYAALSPAMRVGLFLPLALLRERRCQARFSRWLRCEKRDWRMRAGRASRPDGGASPIFPNSSICLMFLASFGKFPIRSFRRSGFVFALSTIAASCDLRSLAEPRDHFSRRSKWVCFRTSREIDLDRFVLFSPHQRTLPDHYRYSPLRHLCRQ